MTRWLDDDEQRAWRSYLLASRRLFDRLDQRLQAESGLSHPDYEILVRLSEAPGRTLRMSDLAERLLFSRSRLSHAMSRLEGQGWVERMECPEDRRGTFARLTDDGFAKLAAAAPGHVSAVRELLLDPLSPAQVRELGATSDAVLDRLDEPSQG